MKQLKYGRDVHEGDICVYLGSYGSRYIIKVAGEGRCNEYIGPNGTFFRSGGGCSGNWVEATPEEEMRLKMSIEDKQIVSLDRVKEVLKTSTPTINNSYSII